MSKIEVNTIEPQSGTTVTLGASGDTLSVSSGATLNTSSATLTLADKQIPVAKLANGTILQTVIATNGSQTSVSTASVETANVQASLTPTSATTKILAFYTVGGVATENANRLEGKLRWGTSSGTTAGTEVANQYMANNGVAVNDMGTWAMSALIDHNTTSTVYVNGTVYTHDSNTTRYFNVYGSDSQLVLLEVQA